MTTLESLRSQCCNGTLEEGNFIIVHGVPGRFIGWRGNDCEVMLVPQDPPRMIEKIVPWTAVQRNITDNELRTLFM